MKNKNDNFEKLGTKILFYREGKKYYFEFNNEKYECNSINISKLKEQLTLPYKISFYGLSRAQFGKIISSFLDESLDVIYRKVSDDSNNILKFEAIFFEVKKYSAIVSNAQEIDYYGCDVAPVQELEELKYEENVEEKINKPKSLIKKLFKM